MSEHTRFSEGQFGTSRPEEQAAVRTTIVGGRPAGSGQRLGPIPRGVEVLVKKAAVDAEFREVLLERRAAAADEIGLELDPAEALMLAAVPADQLRAIIQRTTVPQEHRRAFLGQAAAAMLAAVGGMVPGASAAESRDRFHVRGIRPQFPDVPRPAVVPGDAADDALTESMVRSVLAKVAECDPGRIQRGTKLKADLGLTPNQFQDLHDALEAECNVPFSLDVLQRLETVADVVEHVALMREVWPAVFDVLTERLPLPAGTVISAESSLTDDLKATAENRAVIRQDLAGRLRLPPPLAPRTLEQQETVGDLVMLLAAAVRRRKQIESKIQELPRPSQPRPVRGSQPDLP